MCSLVDENKIPDLTFYHRVVVIGHLQQTCLYPRLNAALRNHGNRSLEPFLPYMKLFLSALYQLPLVQVPTYRGVKLELFEVGDKATKFCKRIWF